MKYKYNFYIYSNRRVPSYPKFIAPEDHRADAAHNVINAQIQHLFIGNVLVSQIPQVIVSFPPEDVATRIFASPVLSPYNQSHICQQPFTSPVTCFRIYPLNGKK